MRSIVSICNKGLRYVGGASIVSMNDASRGAQLCKQFYPEIRDELLEAHHWNFTTRYIRLVKVDEQPPFGFSNCYQLPADCIRIRYLKSGDAFEVVEGNKVFTDANPAEAVITARITDPVKFPALFIEVLARKLAAELAVPLMNSTRLEGNMLKKYADVFARAVGVDGATNSGVQEIGSDDWLGSRNV